MRKIVFIMLVFFVFFSLYLLLLTKIIGYNVGYYTELNEEKIKGSDKFTVYSDNGSVSQEVKKITTNSIFKLSKEKTLITVLRIDSLLKNKRYNLNVTKTPGNNLLCGEISLFDSYILNYLGFKTRFWQLKRLPHSIFDTHVIYEFWDTKYNKWVMHDPTFNIVIFDNGLPLSVMEIKRIFLSGKKSNIIYLSNNKLTDTVPSKYYLNYQFLYNISFFHSNITVNNRYFNFLQRLLVINKNYCYDVDSNDSKVSNLLFFSIFLIPLILTFLVYNLSQLIVKKTYKLK